MKQKILPEERRPTLRELLDRQNFARVIEAHNGISGLLGERALTITNGKEKGFHALWISSLTDSVAKGYPDEEIVSIDSRLDTVNQVLNVTAKPLMFDGDTGGFPEQLNFTRSLHCERSRLERRLNSQFRCCSFVSPDRSRVVSRLSLQARAYIAGNSVRSSSSSRFLETYSWPRRLPSRFRYVNRLLEQSRMSPYSLSEKSRLSSWLLRQPRNASESHPDIFR